MLMAKPQAISPTGAISSLKNITRFSVATPTTTTTTTTSTAAAAAAAAASTTQQLYVHQI